MHYFNFTKGFLLVVALGFSQAKAQYTATFDSLLTQPNSFLNGAGPAVDGIFQSGNVQFPNMYQTLFGGYWSNGFAYSNIKNDSLAGSANLYGSFAKGGYNSSNYVVAQNGSRVTLKNGDAGKAVKGMYVTNSTYAALSMKNGDSFAKKFGGINGNDPDYFALNIKAYSNGVLTNNVVTFYLADFRNSNNTLDYILKQWAWVDLTPLGNADSLLFQLTSSDTGQFGMNTPGFFCIDDLVTASDTADFTNLTLSPNSFWNKRNTTLLSNYTDGKAKIGIDEYGTVFGNAYTISSFGDYWSGGFAISTKNDTTTTGFGNLYSAYSGKGFLNSAAYAVGQNNAKVYIKQPNAIGTQLNLVSLNVTNTTYAALSIKNGDAFGKKFGGVTGNDPDYFKLSIVGYQNGIADTVNEYLADYQSADNTKDFIVKNWKEVSLLKIQHSDSLQFILTSSDNGQFGMNTPAFFAIDHLTFSITNGNEELASNISIQLFPNPSKDYIQVASSVLFHTIIVSDIHGKKMMEQNGNNNSSSISLEHFPVGIYFVQLISNEGTATKKFIKE